MLAILDKWRKCLSKKTGWKLPLPANIHIVDEWFFACRRFIH